MFQQKVPLSATACLFLLAITLTSCGTGGLGCVPPCLVQLYDQASPNGVIELEIGRDGTIHEMEADIPVSDLPDAVRTAVQAKAPGARITGAERELTANAEAWEVKLNHQGRAWEYVLDASGTILESEKELRRHEAPAEVLKAADMAVQGGRFKSVELIMRGDEQEYHVKKIMNGASYKIVLAPDGTVIRKVREARAEIEIPLNDQ